MKRSLLTIFIFFLLVFVPNKVLAASDYSERLRKDNKAVVNINGSNIYFSIDLSVNIENEETRKFVPIPGVSATYANDTVYLTVKRSEINKILKENNFDNIYALLGVYGDYLDLDTNKNYYFFWQGFMDDGNYYYETKNVNYLMREYNMLEVYTSSIQLVGFDPNAIHHISSGIMLFETNELPTNYVVGNIYTKNQIDMNRDKNIINIANRNIQIALIEDEQINLGNNSNIIINQGSLDSNGNLVTEQETVDINNFYAKYFENNKLNYSWTMYDSEGNPIEINVNTYIKIDESENEDTIMSSMPIEFEDLENRMKIISFDHDGDLGGTAKISLYVGDKFEPGSMLRLYYFNPDSEQLEGQVFYDKNMEYSDIPVDKEGYVALTFTHCSEYVLTDVEVSEAIDEKNDSEVNKDIKQETETKKEKNYIPYYIAGGVLIVVVVVNVIFLYKRKKVKKVNNSLENIETQEKNE